MKIAELARRAFPNRADQSSSRPESGESARTGPASGLLPDEAAIGRLRQFSMNHGLRPVDGLVGEHRSRRRGAAPEFSDYSPYTPGDDVPVSYTHLRAHETVLDLVCRLLLE